MEQTSKTNLKATRQTPVLINLSHRGSRHRLRKCLCLSLAALSVLHYSSVVPFLKLVWSDVRYFNTPDYVESQSSAGEGELGILKNDKMGEMTFETWKSGGFAKPVSSDRGAVLVVEDVKNGNWSNTRADLSAIRNLQGNFSLPKHNLYDVDKRNNTPSIAFLFMTSRGLNENLWKRWFPSQDSRYSIFVHSIPSNTTIPLGPFFCPHAIPSVRTRWYQLHDGMMRVLQHAFDKDKNAQQFVFVSVTTIPLVSFEEVYQRLVVQTGGGRTSRFCWMDDPQRAWKFAATFMPDIRNLNQTRKAEMWSSLSRPHVAFILEQRARLHEWNKVFIQKRRRGTVGAPDECFFPTLLNIHGYASQFESCEVRLSNCCPTHVVWSTAAQAPINVDRNIRLSDICMPDFPCTFQFLYEAGLRRLVQQGYLFLRKVTHSAIIFGSNGIVYSLSALMTMHKGLPLEETDPADIPSTNEDIIRMLNMSAIKNFSCPAPQI